MKILIEIKPSLKSLEKTNMIFQSNYDNEEDRQVNVDWKFFKEINYNKRNIIPAKKQAIKLSKRSDIC